MSAIRVLLVDDHQLVRAGFRLMLDLEEGIEVVGEAVDGLDAVEKARELAPDVICMDVQMPTLDGIEATRLVVRDTESKVIILTTFRDDAAVQAALRAGASGFVLKNSPPAVLIESIRTVHAGDALIDPQVTKAVIAAMRPGGESFTPHAPSFGAPAARPQPPEVARLTEREREVLTGVARGLSNAAIGAELFVSEATVKTHVSNLLAKLGVPDRVHAVIFAYEHGLVERES